MRNVARCWTYETSVVLGEDLPDELPYNEYYEYYAPDFNLHYPTNPTMENLNTRTYIETVKTQAGSHRVPIRIYRALMRRRAALASATPSFTVAGDGEPENAAGRALSLDGRAPRHAAACHRHLRRPRRTPEQERATAIS